MSKLIDEKVFNTIVKMAVPMLAGTFAMNTYHLTNTWFVSRLGTEALAAISFTFPVVMLLMFLTRGIGTGAMTLTAHALGAGDRKKAAALTTHAIMLAFVFSIVLALVGIITIKPVFTVLGAKGSVLALIYDYMKIWYIGCVIMVVQIVASDVIIATGNTKAISVLMVSGTVFNVFFDWIFIFGNLGSPALGIKGAALATLLSQLITLLGAFFILNYRMKLIDFSAAAGNILSSWTKILKFRLPGALGIMLNPIAAAIITRLVAGFGDAAVAASGVAGRIEMFAFMIPMTVGISIIPFVAQNYGAGRIDRIMEARKGTMAFAVLYGIFIALIFIIFADPMARFFSGDQTVIDVLKSYIYITCAGYGMMEVHRYSGFCITGVHEPLKASFLDIIRIIVLLVPLSLFGSRLMGLNGIFFGRLITDFCAGFIGIWWSGKILEQKTRI